MRKLDEIADDLSQIIKTKFQAVRLSGMQTGEQFLKELAPLNPATLPAVIIAFRAAAFDNGNAVRSDMLELVMVDRFRASSNDRALGIFRRYEDLLDLFPPEGRNENDVWYYPVETSLIPAADAYVCIALQLKVQQ